MLQLPYRLRLGTCGSLLTVAVPSGFIIPVVNSILYLCFRLIYAMIREHKQGKVFYCLGFPEYVSWKFLTQNYPLYLNNGVSTI